VVTIERVAVIRNRMGLHARPAAELVKVAETFESEISLGKDGIWVNGKSIMGVLTLAAERGSEVGVRAEGDDAEAAAEALVQCLEKEYGLT
jgi:phosphocarrier protein HPr